MALLLKAATVMVAPRARGKLVQYADFAAASSCFANPEPDADADADADTRNGGFLC